MSPAKPHPVSDDLTAGQLVILTARWILVLAGLLLTLLAPGTLGALRFQIMVLLVLAVANFYLCAQVFTRQPTLKEVVYVASLADLIVITLIVLSQGGFKSNTYVFYFPALLAISVAFSTPMLLVFTSGVLAVYAFIGAASLNNWDGDLQILVIRLLMLTAVAVCGNQYWRMERSRRASLTGATSPRPVPVPAPEHEAALHPQPAGD
jgi:hypothetical protein